MKKTFKTLMTVAALGAVSLPSASAAVIAEYAFNSGSASATSSDANATAGDFTVGSGLTGTAGFSGTTNNAFARTTGTLGSGGSTSFANAQSANDYFTVTITPSAFFEMNLTSFSFDYGYSSNPGFTDGENTLRAYITTSTDNHATFFNENTDGYTTITNPASTGSSVIYPNSKSLDLSGAAFQNISTAFEFRIYLSDSYNETNLIHRLDNVFLNGTIAAVPEPSSVTLLGLGSLALAFRRKR